MKNRNEEYQVEDARLTAYALGEASDERLEAWIAATPEAQTAVREIREFSATLERELGAEGPLENGPKLTEVQRGAIDERLDPNLVKARSRSRRRSRWISGGALLAAAAGVFFCVRIWSGASGGGGGGSSPFAYNLMGDGPARATELAPLDQDTLNSRMALGYGGGGPATSPPFSVGFELHRGPARASARRRLDGLAYTGPEEDGEPGTEAYDHILDNAFVRVSDDPLSTFSIDVDTASYSNVRRFLLAQSMLPPKDAVRIEELINYFPYEYPAPDAGRPFSVNVEVASAPWQPEHRLVKIGLKGREVNYAERKNANLVFLLDVSGSMSSPLKLPLLVDAMSLLVENLDPSDRVAIAVYAGSSGLVLDSTSCADKPRILAALERLQAGGSTNGGAGIQLAYDVAQQNFVEGGINRVILATDGDFNVGTTSQGDLVRLIEDKARSGVFLSVLGFGSGNLKDSTMEQLADKGNGNYAYIDSRREARKVLVEQLGGTLVTIAKDVKIQVEFNPAEVEAFRLIGYENRVLAHRDFNDDTKDAGEIGSGHTVTALYEVVPKGVRFEGPGLDPLRYQEEGRGSAMSGSGELLTVKLRYKSPEGSTSQKLEVPVRDRGARIDAASEDLRFAAAVAGFGMLLRASEHRGDASWEQVLRLAREGQGVDVGGYRAEFQLLVQRARSLAGE